MGELAGLLVGLAVLGLMVWLYLTFIGWLFISVGPGFLFHAGLLLSFAVPIVYVRQLLKVFSRDGGSPATRRNWLFVLVIPLVLLIHLDLLWLGWVHLDHLWKAAAGGVTRLPVPWVKELGSILALVEHNAIINREALALASALLPSGCTLEQLVLFGALLKSALIVPIVLLVRGLASDLQAPLDPEPARLSYFHGQALKDLGALTTGMIEDLAGLVAWAALKLWFLLKQGYLTALIWPLVLMAYVALAAPVAIAVLTSLLFILMHALALGFIRILVKLASGVLGLLERAVILSRAGYAKCPHAACHRPVPLPVFLCPACFAEHSQLVPGRFGVLSRACGCGRAQLPTLFWLGKGRLKSLCPHCRQGMSEELFGGSVHLPIYGGPSAGKTMFMMAAAWQALEGKVPGLQAHLIDELCERDYRSSWKPDFQAGSVREKTLSRFPEAFLLSMRRDRGLPASVYLYDPAGEALQSEADLKAHTFMNYIDGLALLIDPLSLPSFAARYRELGGPDLARTTSRMDPEETLTRVVNVLEGLGQLSRRRGCAHRVAVVFTKADVPGFAAELGLDLEDPGPPGTRWGRLGRDHSPRIKAWLARNEPRLLQLLETRFKEVRFFAVSALGHLPQAKGPFAPKRVVEPLAWLLSARSSFARPILGRLTGRLLEAGAVVLVLVALLSLPVWLACRTQPFWPAMAAYLHKPGP